MLDPERSHFALEVPASSVRAIAEAVLELVESDLHARAAAQLDHELARRGGNPADLVSATEVADQLGVHVRTVYRALTTGQLVGMRIGSHWRVRRDEIDAWLQRENEHRPLPPVSSRPELPADSFRRRAHQRRPGR